MSVKENIIEHCSNFFTEMGVCENCTEVYPFTCRYNDCQKKCISCLNRMYRENQVEYDWCSNLRYAYVLKYFFAHRAELQKLLDINRHKISKHIVGWNNRSIKVCSFGPGPGTDYAGYIEFLVNGGGHHQFEFSRVEKELKWQEQYDFIKDCYKDKLQEYRINCEEDNFHVFDLNEINSWDISLDIVFFSYVLSELAHSDIDNSGLKLFWSWFKDSLNTNSIIILNDRNERRLRNYFNIFIGLVETEFPNSYYNNYYFETDNLEEFGERHQISSWCGESIPDDIRNVFESKTTCRSCQSIIFVNKE
ncbi:MAG: hypothetical protein O2U61_01840 [Candidatus Bathyarchaeota archaeon]|nr:hypothetical protein [Candidatus Bathyarchaeota archaeon]